MLQTQNPVLGQLCCISVYFFFELIWVTGDEEFDVFKFLHAGGIF